MTQPRLVGGRYELGELIGYGGMAEVHRGRDARLGRDVAIKVLRADLARDPAFLHRFRREAQAAAGLNHPSIVSVYDTGEDVMPDGATVPYIVMEFVSGRTLREIIKTNGMLPVRRSLEIVADVCGALDFSHRNGIVHRDIKPANVMITESGAVKVMDFGIARAVADNQATVTQTANVIGTAQYLSPEQARGETVDARSDVYSTGCLLYELVTGAPPFQGDSPVAVAYQHVRENAAPPSSRNREVSPAIDSIVMKALAKNQLNRYQTAAEMRSDLERALANQPVSAEAVMSDAERTQFIARMPAPVPGTRRDEVVYDDEDEARGGLVWVAIVVALLLVIGAATAAVLLLGKNSSGAKKVAVASVIGQLPAAAEDQLRAQGLNPVAAADAFGGPCDDNQTVPEGHVCTLDPKAGSSIPKGSNVTYTLFKPPSVQVPQLVGLPVAQAREALHAKGLKSKELPTNTADYAQGIVAKASKNQFDLVPPGSTITIYVSTGKVKLIDVRGKKLADAVTQLNQAQWTNVDATQTVETHDKAKDGTVADEQPTPGIAYSQDTLIRLIIYKYVPAEPTCTPIDTTIPTDTAVPTDPILPPCTTP